MDSIDLVKPETEGSFRLVGIVGDPVTVRGRIERMNLVEHRILL